MVCTIQYILQLHLKYTKTRALAVQETSKLEIQYKVV